MPPLLARRGRLPGGDGCAAAAGTAARAGAEAAVLFWPPLARRGKLPAGDSGAAAAGSAARAGAAAAAFYHRCSRAAALRQAATAARRWPALRSA